jgi:hypothetical protein
MFQMADASIIANHGVRKTGTSDKRLSWSARRSDWRKPLLVFHGYSSKDAAIIVSLLIAMYGVNTAQTASESVISGLHFLSLMRRYNHLDLVIALLKDHRPGVRRIAAASLSWVRDARLIPPNCQIGPR